MNARLPLAAVFALSLATACFAQPIPEAAVRPTEIESVRLRVQNDGDTAYFVFSEEVRLQATNLILECDTLEVFARRDADAEAAVGTIGAIQRIVATGNVRIEQAQRVATAGKAVVEPNEERIVLTEKPVVTQAGTRLEADELIIERGNGTIIVNPTTPNKLRFIGPAIDDMGFENEKPAEPEAEAPPAEDSAAEENEAPPAEPEGTQRDD